MDRIKRMQELVDEFGKLVLEEFPEYTNASMMVSADGFANFDVTEWEEHKAGEAAKYRFLFKQEKYSSEKGWHEDSSKGMNAFLAKRKTLYRKRARK